jgi:hypothetical protein
MQRRMIAVECLVKVEVKVKFTIEKATKVQSGSRVKAILFL